MTIEKRKVRLRILVRAVEFLAAARDELRAAQADEETDAVIRIIEDVKEVARLIETAPER